MRVLGIALDGILAATSAVAAHVHLIDRERGVFGAAVERGADASAWALLRAVGRDTATLNAIMAGCHPRSFGPAQIAALRDVRRAPTAGWEVVAVPLLAANGQPVGVALLAAAWGGAPGLTERLPAGLGGQLGAAAEQARLFQADGGASKPNSRPHGPTSPPRRPSSAPS